MKENNISNFDNLSEINKVDIRMCVLGTDERSKYIRKMYISEFGSLNSFDNANIIIGPTPFSKDDVKINGESLECNELINYLAGSDKVLYAGAISKSMKTKLKKKNIRFYDILEEDGVAILNAIPTAEGAISIAMNMTDFTIHGSNVLVLGYGNIGKILSKMLYGIGANVYCEARNKKDLAFISAMGYNSISLDKLDSYLGDMDIIFNTIPSMILDEKRLQCLKEDSVIIDLASSPGGVDFSKAKELNINTTWALALPTKVAPRTAAVYLKNVIDELIREDEFNGN